MQANEEPKKLRAFLVSLPFFALWIWGLNWTCARYASGTYFSLYIKYGTSISAAMAFLALVWEKLEEQKGLLSWHPAEFLMSCFDLAGVFVSAVAATLGGVSRVQDDRPITFLSSVETLWDSISSILMALLMAIGVICWLVVIAPAFYLLTLFTGGPARLGIKGLNPRLIIKGEGFPKTIQEWPRDKPVPDDAVDVSLDTRPFALTNALNAAVLLLANFLLSRPG